MAEQPTTSQVPLIVDDSHWYPPGTNISGMPVITLEVNDQALHAGVLYGFSRSYRAAAQNPRFVGRRWGFTKREVLDHNSYFYEYPLYGGSVLALDVGFGYRFLRSWCQQICAVRATAQGWGTVLYELPGYCGLSMHIKTSQGIPDLGLYGWANRATSVAVYWW